MKTSRTRKWTVNDFDPQAILYLTGDVNYSYVHLLNGQVVLSSRTLKWFAQQWPSFVRVHKHALVNLAYVKHIKLASSLRSPSYLIMRDKASLTISRRRVITVVEQLDQLGSGVSL
ncbi:LytTR family transcriptional regulator [Spirosoma sp. HMF3257]|uniref:LytTR family transcriptional regulator n=1 Tax=Spirosoma telluris TaxID=2183553 RepID=A0A327NZ53_9BACT|nr:LytTR family transcriptional regulator [Spirosoma telluris]RAI78158.1 LytTR family transcriptional regulator [Spirosoma telluris]